MKDEKLKKAECVRNMYARTKQSLLNEAKLKGIVGRHKMTKDELAKALLEKGTNANTNPNIIEYDVKKRIKYLESCALGTIIAFKDASRDDNKYRTGEIIKRIPLKGELEVRTEYDALYTVNYNDVIWVKTGDRWPRKVYELLKGNVR